MKKLFLLFIFTIILTGLHSVSSADSPKIITLKDGSVLKGKVLELKGGIYTIETSNLGNIQIAEPDILTIASPEAAAGSSSEAQKAELKKQVEQVQGAILTDQGLMEEIEKITQDEEIKQLLSDPKLIEDVMSFDQNKLQQNTNVQDLINNPKMQELMDTIQKKMPAQQ